MDMGADELQEILQEFHTEAEEGLDNLEQDLIKLEALADSGETDSETVDRIFRVLHTLKGGAGFLGLDAMSKLAHAGENLLDEVRGNRVAVSKPVMDALLETNDALRNLLEMSKEGEDAASVDNTALIAQLEELSLGDAAPAAPKAEVAPPPPPAVEEPAAPAAPAAEPEVDPSLVDQDLLAEVLGDGQLNPELAKPEEGDIEAAAAPAVPAAEPEIDPSLVDQDLLAEVLGDGQLNPDLAKPEEGDLPAGTVDLPPPQSKAPEAPKPVEANPAEVVVQRGAPEPERRQAKEDRRQNDDDNNQQRDNVGRRAADKVEQTIRVDITRLDQVMNLVGELVLARNSIVRQLKRPEMQDFLEEHDFGAKVLSNMDMLSRVTQDLQMSVLSTRMQPIKKVFDKIPRQVRTLKGKLGKEVEVVIEGEHTEVDKTLVEELADPMVHLIRNALDHGIETPDERIAKGKNPEGTLTIRAFYEGNNVVIEVEEDGKGINPEVIKNIAVKKGVISEAQAAQMPDSEAVELVLAPGFSTAEQVSDVSGRGVGMDVVNAKIKAVKGSLKIKSEVDKGTTMRINLPLTLAIMQALMVETRDEGFAIPIGDINEVIRFKPETVRKVNDKQVINLRGETLPLYYLDNLTRQGHLPRENAKGYVIVVQEGEQSVGVIVDNLLGQEEAVVKPVTDLFSYNPAISGATITGDGRVHMIVDVPFLLKSLTQKVA
jgi:two-component system chemotaxis sensor kinase CheA